MAFLPNLLLFCDLFLHRQAAHCQPVDLDIADTQPTNYEVADRERANCEGSKRERAQSHRANGHCGNAIRPVRSELRVHLQAGTAFQKYRTKPRFSSRSFTRNIILTFVPESICPCSTSVMSVMKRPPSPNVIMP